MMLALLAPCLASASELPDSLRVVVDQAQTADLPTLPLEQKALEGLAKGVDEGRISAVLDDLLAEWKNAERMLGVRADAPDRAELVPAAAAALHQGAPIGAVLVLAAESRPAEALWTLSDVLYAGLSSADAERLVQAALANRQPDVALRELPEATRLLIAAEGPKGAALTLTATMAGGSTPLAAVTDGGPGNSGDHGSKAAGASGANNGQGGDGKAGGKAP